jgi:hypothetical protein
MKQMILCLLMIVSVITNAQNKSNEQILKEDCNTFIRFLEETHPDPYSAYGGKVEFKRKVRNVREQISETTTNSQFVDMLNNFLSELEDGHTSVYKSAENDTTSSNRLLPLKLGIATDGIFIESTTDLFLPYRGSKIVAINNILIDSLLPKAAKIYPAENKYGQYRILRSFLRNENTASKLIDDLSHLQLTLIRPDKKQEKLNITYIEKPEWTKTKSAIELDKKNGLLYGQILNAATNPVGYFEWNGMYSRELIPTIADNKNFLELLDFILQTTYSNTVRPDNDSVAIQGIPELYAAFSEFLHTMKAQKSNYLIIDLRMNSGGWTPLCRPLLYMLYGDKFLEYNSKAEYNKVLSPLSLKHWSFESIEQYNEKYHTNYLLGDMLFGSFYGTNTDRPIEEKRQDLSFISYQGAGVEYTKDLNGNPIHESHVIILTSPITFSAAYHFVYFLTEIGNATIVGVPSGQAGNAFMEATDFELPNTKIQGRISNAIQLFYPNNPVKGKVLMPDFAMQWIDYQKYNFDENAEILYVLDLIKSGKIKR